MAKVFEFLGAARDLMTYLLTEGRSGGGGGGGESAEYESLELSTSRADDDHRTLREKAGSYMPPAEHNAWGSALDYTFPDRDDSTDFTCDTGGFGGFDDMSMGCGGGGMFD
jgi:hypothetical protein